MRVAGTARQARNLFLCLGVTAFGGPAAQVAMMRNIGHALGDAVTRADIEPLATKEFVRAEIAGVNARIAGVRTEMASIEARLFRHLWVMAIGIVGATFTLLKLFP